MSKIPSTDFDFSAEAEVAFDDWFHGIYGRFALRSEYFYGDCVLDDEENLKDLMYKWVHAAFATGYERGFENGLQQPTPSYVKGATTDQNHSHNFFQ